MKLHHTFIRFVAALLFVCLMLPVGAMAYQPTSDTLTEGPWEVRMSGFEGVTYMVFFPDGFGQWYVGDYMDIDFDWMLLERCTNGYTIDEYIEINFHDDEGQYYWGYMNMPWQVNDYRLTWIDMHLFLTDTHHSGFDDAGYSAAKSLTLAQTEDIPFLIDGLDNFWDDPWDSPWDDSVWDDLFDDPWDDDDWDDDWYDNGWYEEDTDQIGIICKDNIFPRPRPGDGKNEYNYEALGQEVTIHTRAMSLKGDEHWWLCISATIRAWGNTYELDHEWIREDYVDPFSYDFDLVPLDPEYGYSDYRY